MKILIAAAALIAAGLYLFWPASEPKNHQPLSICILQELSESAPKNGVPLFSQADFETLITLVSRTGGEIGFGLISDVDEPLARLRVPPVMNPYQKARLRRQADDFRDQVKARLSRELSRNGDMDAAVNRANTFLGEVDGKNRFLILVSEGEPDAKRSKFPAPIPGVKTLVVGGKRRPNLPSALYQESIGGALEYIQSQQELVKK